MMKIFLRLPRLIFIAILIFIVQSSVKAQQFDLHFKHLTPNEGLTQGSVNDIYTDTKGFVWMTGMDGINRFDGLRCLANEEIAPGLGNVGRINGILEDNKGDIWFGYAYGIIKYSYTSNRFEKTLLPEPDVKIFVNQSYTYSVKAIDSENNVLIWLDAKNILLYNTLTKYHKFIQLPGGEKAQISDIITVYDNKIKTEDRKWMVREKDSLFIYRLSGGEKQGLWVLENSLIWEGSIGQSILMPDKNTLLFSNGEGICKYHLQTRTTDYSDKFMSDPVNSMLHLDAKNRLWISNSGNGIFLLDGASLAILHHFVYDENNNGSISSDVVRIFTDKDEMLWVASWGKGVDYCNLKEQRFRSFLSAAESRRGKFSNFIRGIAESADDDFYCSTPSGIIVLNKALRFKHYLPGVTHKIASPDILLSGQYLYYVSDGYADYGLYRYDMKSGKESRYINVSGENFTNTKNLLYQVSKMDEFTLLVSSLNGLWKFETDKGKFDLLPGITTAGEQVCFSYMDKRKQVYKGINLLGMTVYRFEGNSWKEVFRLNKKFNVKHCAEINDSLLWIGTSDGLYLFNTEKLKIKKHFNTDNGLTNNVVYAIMPDSANNLWLSTNKGLSYLNVLNDEFTHFTVEDGLQANEFNTHVALKAKEGRIIFGGVNGLTVVDPDVLAYKIQSPVLQITSIKTDSLLNPFPYNEPGAMLMLKAGIHSFELELTAINFSNPPLCKIKYRLTGYDNDWRTITNPARIWYVKLPPGNYTLEAMASNSRGEFAGDIKKLEIEVKAYWWQKPWFKPVLVLLLALLIVLGVRQYTGTKLRRQRQIMEKELAVQRERERITADLHDDVGATLSSMHIYGELAGSVWDTQPQQSREMVNKISDQSKELMTTMSDIVWSLKSPGEEKNSFLLRLKNYSQDLLAGKGITTCFNIDETLDAKVTNPFARKNILLIAKEAINNIAKYSRATEVVLTFKQEEEEVLLIVSDNGKGIDKIEKGNGNGLGNIEQRCRQLKGTCSIESECEKGVTIACRFPIAIISHIG